MWRVGSGIGHMPQARYARDLQLSGANLFHISLLGNGKPCFLSYLDLTQLEMGAVVEAHLAESSSEDEGAP